MKKIIFSVLSAFCMHSASAQSEFCMKPVHADSEDEAALYFYMDTDFYIQGMQFNVLLPKGVTITTNKSGKIKEGISYDFEGAAGDADWTPVVESKMVGDQQQVNFAIGATGGSKIPAGKGHVFTIYTDTDEMDAGVYPVEINVKKFSNGVDKAVIAEYTSYIVIDEGKGVLVAKNVLGNVVNEFLATDANVTGLNLTGVTAINGTFTYVDGREVEGTTATAAVKYVGNKANYYSVNVPFTGTATGEFYELKSVDENFAVFSTTTTVKAGETYLAKGEVTLTANAAVATIENKKNQTGSYVLDGKFYTGKNLTVPATRGLFKEVPAGSNLRVVIDGELTGITTAEIDAQAGNTYDLQGRQSVNAKNGVFVVNGKKQFVK